MLDKLKQRVKQLIEDKTIGIFIGYEKGDNPELARPVMITAPEEVDKLVVSLNNIRKLFRLK